MRRMSLGFRQTLTVLLVVLMAAPPWAFAQDAAAPTKYKPEELDAILAPVALYPDELLSQMFMASTYPLEVVQADRWVKTNASLKGDALATELEKQSWDPSVKSLVQFPSVLTQMSEKLDWTEKLGNAFLAQQKDVMASVQRLRQKAQAAGNLKTTPEQKVTVEPQTQVIVIEPAKTEVVYVPSYNPTVVYGTWAYPAYPPYPYYPPGYYYGGAFMAGVVMGAAWGYAWGHCNWHGGDIDINVNRNANFNTNINRNNYVNNASGNRPGQGGQGTWQHNPEHRKGVSYGDQSTASKYGRGSQNASSRDAYRGREGQGGADRAGQSGRGGATASTRDAAQGNRGASAGTRDTGASSRGASSDLNVRASGSKGSSGGSSAFQKSGSGAQARQQSSRGSSSRSSSPSRSSGGRSSGGGRKR